MVFWLNAFPPKDGIHRTLSPRALLVGTSLDHLKQCNLPFGTFVHTHEKTDNSMTACTVPALACRPHPNSNGNYLFFSLHTGHMLNRGPRSYTELPMPSTVIDLINSLGSSTGAAPGLYSAETSNDVPFHPNDGATDPNDHILDSTFSPITTDELADLHADEPWTIVGPPNAGVNPLNDQQLQMDHAAAPIDLDNDVLNNNPFAALADHDHDDDDADDNTDHNGENDHDSEDINIVQNETTSDVDSIPIDATSTSDNNGKIDQENRSEGHEWLNSDPDESTSITEDNRSVDPDGQHSYFNTDEEQPIDDHNNEHNTSNTTHMASMLSTSIR
jgi:hypothetical protein